MAIKIDAGLMQPPHIFGGKKLEKPESIVPHNIMKVDYSIGLDDVEAEVPGIEPSEELPKPEELDEPVKPKSKGKKGGK